MSQPHKIGSWMVVRIVRICKPLESVHHKLKIVKKLNYINFNVFQLSFALNGLCNKTNLNPHLTLMSNVKKETWTFKLMTPYIELWNLCGQSVSGIKLLIHDLCEFTHQGNAWKKEKPNEKQHRQLLLIWNCFLLPILDYFLFIYYLVSQFVVHLVTKFCIYIL